MRGKHKQAATKRHETNALAEQVQRLEHENTRLRAELNEAKATAATESAALRDAIRGLEKRVEDGSSKALDDLQGKYEAKCQELDAAREEIRLTEIRFKIFTGWLRELIVASPGHRGGVDAARFEAHDLAYWAIGEAAVTAEGSVEPIGSVPEGYKNMPSAKGHGPLVSKDSAQMLDRIVQARRERPSMIDPRRWALVLLSEGEEVSTPQHAARASKWALERAKKYQGGTQ